MESDSAIPIAPDDATERLSAPAEISGRAGRKLLDDVRSRLAGGARRVVVDLSGAERIDTQGAAYLQLAAASAQARCGELVLEGTRPDVRDMIELVERSASEPARAPRRPLHFFEWLGERALAVFKERREAGELVYDAAYWSILAPVKGQGLRWSAVADELHEMGVRAIGIVVLLNVLLGIIIALLSAAQLRKFGASIYVADLLVIAFTRELAAILTAIIVAARTGAAITAELATMKVQEELDAVRSMGLNVARFLVAPKLWALFVALPVLTAVAMVAGVAGGSLIGVGLLGETPLVWWNELVGAADIEDLVQGFFKSAIFAIIIGLVGCHNGLRVEGGARGVGLATTRSVVMDIFFIIAADMAFASFFFFV